MVFDSKKWPNGAGRDPEKVRAEKHRYYLRHKEQIALRTKKWASNNPEARKEIVFRNNAKSAERKRLWHEAKVFGHNIERSECARCYTKPDKLHDIVVHHIDGNNGKLGKPVNNSKDNLVALCRNCHATIHSHGQIKEYV